MTSVEPYVLVCSVIAALVVVLVPRARVAHRGAGAVVGGLASAAGLAIAAVGAMEFSPAVVVAGGALLGGGLSSLAFAARRPVMLTATLTLLGLLGATRLDPQPEAPRAVPAASIERAIAERAGVRDDGVLRGIVWGPCEFTDHRRFAEGLAATDVDFAIALDGNGYLMGPMEASLAAMIDRIGLPTIWVPRAPEEGVGRGWLPHAAELIDDGVAVFRPAPHLVLVAVDSSGGGFSPERRTAIDAALASAGERKRHLVLALQHQVVALEEEPPPTAGSLLMPDEDSRTWLRERVDHHGVDLVLTNASGASAGRKEGATTYAALGGRSRLLRLEIEPRSMSIVPVDREVGAEPTLPLTRDGVPLVAANRRSPWRVVLLALVVAAAAAWPLLLLGLLVGSGKRLGPQD